VNFAIDSKVRDLMSPYDKEFFRIEVEERNFEDYLKRIKAIDFCGKARVLDCACGIGQWTLALALENKYVEGIDINTSRLFLARHLAEINNVQNIHYSYGNMEQLPYAGEEFDNIFCYGALMFSDCKKTMREFARVLKKRGRIYICANAAGWYTHLLINKGLRNKSVGDIRMATKILLRHLIGRDRLPVLLSKAKIITLANMSGLELVEFDHEGSIIIGHEIEEVRVFYPQRPFGLTTVFECILTKR
jgi:SAM-dependent methyltransferase